MIHYIRAELIHAQNISDLIDLFHKESMLLKRSLEEISRSINSFFVAVSDTVVIGCCSLYIYSNELAEIRSLAVCKEWQGKGIGGGLVSRIIDETVKRQIQHVFALTLKPQLFQKFGFKIVPKNELPEKIWNDCMNCSSAQNCPEIPVLKILK